MKRKIIRIDEAKCSGCGLCAEACQEGAIAMENGKAKLVRDDYCDGLGNCLPACPTGAISFEEREAAAYEGARVKAPGGDARVPGGCPGSMAKSFRRPERGQPDAAQPEQSELRQWPVQLKLVPANAPYFDGARLLVAADCSAYACAGFHQRFLRNRVALIGCPKLDACDYSEKLTEILRNNDIRSVTVVRMEVPCCGGIERAVKKALADSGKMIPWQVVVLSTDERILEE